MKDTTNNEPKVEIKNYLDKIETATTTQVSQSIIAQIVQKIKKSKKTDPSQNPRN